MSTKPHLNSEPFRKTKSSLSTKIFLTTAYCSYSTQISPPKPHQVDATSSSSQQSLPTPNSTLTRNPSLVKQSPLQHKLTLHTEYPRKYKIAFIRGFSSPQTLPFSIESSNTTLNAPINTKPGPLKLIAPCQFPHESPCPQHHDVLKTISPPQR